MAKRRLSTGEPITAILHAATVRPFDTRTLRETLGTPDVVLVEPYLAGTSVNQVSVALADVPHRVLGLGVSVHEQRRYGTVADHDAIHGLDAAGLRDSIECLLSARVRNRSA